MAEPLPHQWPEGHDHQRWLREQPGHASREAAREVRHLRRAATDPILTAVDAHRMGQEALLPGHERQWEALAAAALAGGLPFDRDTLTQAVTAQYWQDLAEWLNR